MSLTAEQQKELAQFPPALRALVEAELEVGNSIIEVGHTHPAPPVGAYIKLANKISTRPRASAKGLDFYERNNSIYCGEFTDSNRFYFVLEAPNPPPPEPDMDVIRAANAPEQDALVQLAHRRTGASVDIALRRSFAAAEAQAEEASESDCALIATETATRLQHVLHFRDKRPPHEVQFALERELMTLFSAAVDDGKLKLRAKANVNGARYNFELRFVAALLLGNYYSLHTDVTWADQPATHHDYFRKTAKRWLQLWTRDLTAANPPAANAGLGEPYRRFCSTTLHALAHLNSVAAIQQAIVDGMKGGGRFGTAHKEGGANIYWRDGRFIRSDYGDNPDVKEYTDAAEFLKMLRQFCHFDVTRHAGTEPVSELDAWKLILRRMSLAGPIRASHSPIS